MIKIIISFIYSKNDHALIILNMTSIMIIIVYNSVNIEKIPD